ncbi:anti-sigma factor [Pedobacter yulinensis]|uniref:Anti-sigma factor n=1 Tax=Pedobacter yulinensis TaxID=2126353 RepID=A0A2T3HJF3_9SPHI|nr:FecR domain-containing protein [Pedobacter yulinensis]PST82511.1 anti-sigma factor [Pedobacter yulinensis]
MAVKDRLAQLLRLYADNNCTKEEFEELFLLIDRSPNEDLLEPLLSIYAQAPEESSHTDKDWNTLYEQRFSAVQSRQRRMTFFRLTGIAATILIIGMAALFLFRTPARLNNPGAGSKIPPAIELTPGGNQAVLTLSNGIKIALTAKENGLIATQSGVQVTKTADGKLQYRIAGSKPGSAPQFNTIETPRGGQYEVVLPDGTHVWLNALSALTFPTHFSGREREVTLRGEAYFEVARNKHLPFRVNTDRQDIEVLGTHFNINSYQDEQTVRTTLVEGSVKVIPADAALAVVLRPGQQAVLRHQKPEVRTVDTDMVLGWKKGYFVFSNNDLESIMRQVSRWYDVDVEFKNNSLRKRLFSGTVSRFENASQVLDLLELTGIVHFKVEGRRIMVM